MKEKTQTRNTKEELLGMKRKRSLDDILANFSPAAQDKIISKRIVHSCLMELPRQTIQFLQRKALYQSYMNGEARRLLDEPVEKKLIDKDGFEYTKITNFRYRKI